MCADTQRPARLASVKLVRVPAKEDAKADPKKGPMDDSAPASDAVETSLDGSYTVRNVKPGAYYVAVDKEGYLVPLGEFSLRQLADPDEETKTRIAGSVRPIAVSGNQVTNEDVVLERGASVSGTVRYDDGSPAGGIGIMLLEKDKSGKWVPKEAGRYRQMHGFSATDDNGYYRIAGLPPGEYAIQANLALNDHETTMMPMGNGGGMVQMEMMKTRFSLPLYSGDVLHKPDAKPYTLGTGEVRAGADMVFPLAKLHKVSGQLAAKDGHAINGGKVTLFYPDDNSEMTETEVQFEDAAFHLEFVPEGAFTLKASNVKDVTKVQVENTPGYTPRFHEESKTVKAYGDAEQPLLVKGDASDVLVAVPESGKTKATAP